MKIERENGGETLLMTAEVPDDLDFLEKMEGVFAPGPWRGAEFMVMNVAELGFFHADAGKRYLVDGEVQRVMARVRLNIAWMSYAKPKDPAVKAREYAALGLGHGLIHGFELAFRDAQQPLDAGGVGGFAVKT